MPDQSTAVVAVQAGPVAPPAPELPEVSPQTARRRQTVLQPLAPAAMVSAAPAIGVGPTSNRGGRLLLAALAALTVIAALRRQYPTIRLGAAPTAMLAAFRPAPAGLAAPHGGAHAHGKSTIP